eukprot:COSAG01_NODE_6551_length_3614_cov_2.669513_5_plen_112_part_00
MHVISQAGWNAEKDRSIRAVRDSLTTVRVTNTPPFIRAQPRSAERPTPPRRPTPAAQSVCCYRVAQEHREQLEACAATLERAAASAAAEHDEVGRGPSRTRLPQHPYHQLS